MEIWLIQNGKKTGPFNDYEIRDRISNRLLDSDDYAWHEGLPSWVKLQEIDLFKKEFDAVKTIQPPPLPAIFPINREQNSSKIKCPYLLRRFWARWFDLMIYLAAWWLLMYVVGGNIKAMILNQWVHLSLFIPWFAIEAALLHWFGTTPGKWLLGIRVMNEDGSALTLKSAILRSLIVWIAGLGFGWGFLTALCHVMSWFTARNIGKPVWDHIGQHKVTAVPVNAFKLIALIFLFIAAMQLQVAVRGPHDQEIFLQTYPQFKEFFEKGKPWHLPIKN
jgi:RDD family/GYF domain 2